MSDHKKYSPLDELLMSHAELLEFLKEKAFIEFDEKERGRQEKMITRARQARDRANTSHAPQGM